jgi:hypothetical protein
VYDDDGSSREGNHQTSSDKIETSTMLSMSSTRKVRLHVLFPLAVLLSFWNMAKVVNKPQEFIQAEPDAQCEREKEKQRSGTARIRASASKPTLSNVLKENESKTRIAEKQMEKDETSKKLVDLVPVEKLVATQTTSEVPSTDQSQQESAYSSAFDRSTQSNLLAYEEQFDIISVGSLLKQDFQKAQQNTFGTHRAVRNFFRITEQNDTDATCYTNLTMTDVKSIIGFCKNLEGQSDISAILRRRLFWPNRHPGWMCAQKRPVEALFAVFQHYRATSQELPDYLLIVDDDTWLNMESIYQNALSQYKSDTPHIVAGCLWSRPKRIQFQFPYGGYGSLLTRAALERLLTPVDCSQQTTDFSILFCWRLEQNTVGEATFYKPGMSVAELMFAYASRLPFTHLHKWINGTGYCFHSDHAIGYFFNFYHIQVPGSMLGLGGGGEHWDRLRRDNSYKPWLGNKEECKYEKEHCPAVANFCHYMKPAQMYHLHRDHSYSDMNDNETREENISDSGGTRGK